MPSACGKHYKKPEGSVVVLGYFIVLPFQRKSAYLSALKGIAEDAEDILDWAVDMACLDIQADFVKKGVLLDDGVIEAKCIAEESHLCLYMKIPATLAVHSAISQLRVEVCKKLKKSALAPYLQSYQSLFKTTYLAMASAADPTPVGCIHRTVYSDYLRAFYMENSLTSSPDDIKKSRVNKFDGKKDFLSRRVNHYV